MAIKNKAPDAAPMGEAPASATTTPGGLIEIEELRAKKKTRAAVFAGVCSAKGWRPGRKITEAEYDAAVAEFTGAAMDGRSPAKPAESEAKD